MSMLNQLVISAAVEGSVDEAVIRRLIGHVGLTPGPIYGKKGKDDLRKKIRAYNLAAQHAPWVILVDLDNDADCALALRQAWLSNPAPNLCFRVAVRQVEAWLMADRETLAKFLDIPQDKIPNNPEGLPNAKWEMAKLAQASRSREIRDDMARRPGSGCAVGPAYPSRLIEYAQKHWRPAVAAQRADSLRRAIACLKQLSACLKLPSR